MGDKSLGVESLGVEFWSNWGHQDFTLFSIGYHMHFKDDPSDCQCRFGVRMAVLGFHITIGAFST